MMSASSIESKRGIKEIAIEVLKSEAAAILHASSFISESFENCIEEILKCKGRLVITGVGKSAIIANKIVATLNSTGTPALFMHAVDAIHGDLGMIQSDDLIMCISKSGNTPEIKVLVPLLKRKGQKLIALVSNIDSFLAKQADFVINATIMTEACPHNLAPTTSTTLHLALGDALAVCLLKSRNFTSQDFAYFHPGGSLGKQLYLKVKDIVDKTIPIVQKDDSVRNVILEISSKRLGATAVVDGGKLVGIITDGDLRRMLQYEDSVTNLLAEHIMSTSPKTIDFDDFAAGALQVMQENKISQLVVVKQNEVAGLLHIHDLLREGIV